MQIGDEISTDNANCSIVITPLATPPGRKSVSEWLDRLNAQKTNESDLAMTAVKPRKDKAAKNKLQDRSQIEAPSMNNSFGFRASFGNCLEAKAVHQVCALFIIVFHLKYLFVY